MKDGTVSGQQTVAGVPFTEISAAVAGGMSGAAVGDMQGRVVGTVSWQPDQETQAFNFMTATSTVRDILASNGCAQHAKPSGPDIQAWTDRLLRRQVPRGCQGLRSGARA
jgi:hypothetical protein